MKLGFLLGFWFVVQVYGGAPSSEDSKEKLTAEQIICGLARAFGERYPETKRGIKVDAVTKAVVALRGEKYSEGGQFIFDRLDSNGDGVYDMVDVLAGSPERKRNYITYLLGRAFFGAYPRAAAGINAEDLLRGMEKCDMTPSATHLATDMTKDSVFGNLDFDGDGIFTEKDQREIYAEYLSRVSLTD